MPCCSRLEGDARRAMEPGLSLARVLENLPGVGHLIAAMFSCCCADHSRAEKAGLKASVGLLCGPCNCLAEAVDEMGRRRSEKMYSFPMIPRLDWMKQFRQVTLAQICLPATHHSASANVAEKLSPVPMGSGWARCQAFSVEQQLHGGVRFLDLRLMTHKKEIWLHHNIVVCVKLREVLTVVRDFVKENPSEIVGLYLNNDGKPLDWGTAHSLINELLGHCLIPEHMKEMKIGDVTDNGKNVMIFNVPDVAYSWTCLQSHWPNKPWPDELEADLKNKLAELANRTGQDGVMFWYKAECTPDGAMIVRHLGGVPGACAARCAKEKFIFIEDLAAAVNHRAHNVLMQLTHLPFNILSTDYVHDDVISRIIELNAQQERQSVQQLQPVQVQAAQEESPLLQNDQGFQAEVHPSAVIVQPSFNDSLRSSTPLNNSMTPHGSSFRLTAPQHRLEVWETAI